MLPLALLLPPLALALSPQQRASLHSGAWPAGQPPRSVPSSKTVDGPLLGNGDVGVVLGVERGRELGFWVSKSDLWHLEPGRTGPKALGGVRVALADAALPVQFALRQDIGRGVVEWNITKGQAALVSGSTTISQADGVSSVVTTIESAGSAQHLTVTTWGQPGAASGESGGISWIARSAGGCSNATAAIATAVVAGGATGGGGAQGQAVTVAPGKPAMLTHTVVSSVQLGKRTGNCSWESHDPVPVAIAKAATMDAPNAWAIVAASRRFWADYWNKSTISLPTQPEVERYWYSAQYILGSSSRAGRATNGIW